ncbi:hypothetical protein [Hydrogenophaga sp. PML113]|uniref:hypothetical protein n=1 Tax=Hydrogenophaga sp. PML113 TaxID=1899350 RepID=UPI000878DBB8|nr:hypothetical protein [Hydrogenophaga sp. PML113]
MTANRTRPSLSEVAIARGLRLHTVQRSYSAHADEVAAFNRLLLTCDRVIRALLAHPAGTVASINGFGYWLTVYDGALHLVSAGLLQDFLDDDVMFVGECTGLSASDLDNVEQSMDAWLSSRFYLEFDPQRLDALVQRQHPSAPDASL